MSRINRREMLAAAGAGAFLAPFTARFSGKAQAAPPKRFIMFWHANGAPKSGDFGFAGPAQAAKGGVNLMRVNYPGTGDHKMGMPYSVTGAVDNPPKKISIDQAIAKSGGKPALVLTGMAKPQNYRGWCSFSDSGATVLPVQSPRTAFLGVFGVDPGGNGPPSMTGGGMVTDPGTPPKPGTPPLVEYGPELEAAILNRAMEDVKQVKARLPMSEREKMDAQLDALANISRNLMPVTGATGRVQAITTSDCSNKTMLASSFREPSNGWSFQDRIKLHIELIVASFLCDLRRVATLMVTPGGHDSMEFSFLGVSGMDPHNTIAHKIYDDSANVDRMKKIKVWEMEQLAYLLKRLGETPDPGGGTLLDSTVVLATTECKDGNHGTGPIPIMTAGAGKGVSGSSYPDILSGCARAAGGSF